jgi:NADH-quinone oxidoreductase subunit J
MVLFLFIVIMMKFKPGAERLFPLHQLLPAAVFGVVYIAIGIGLVLSEPGSRIILKTAQADPGLFGQYIFEKHWLSIEIVSLLLLVALIGALLLGRRSKKAAAAKPLPLEGEL